MEKVYDIIKQAFPKEIRESINILLSKFKIETEHTSLGSDLFIIKGEEVSIPQRIYYKAPDLNSLAAYTAIEKDIINGLFSRHFDGYIRQKALQNLLASDNYWVTPYIVQIMGEYVIEILFDLNEGFELLNKKNVIGFIKENPTFYSKTKDRVASYWDCYYRLKFPNKIRGVKVKKEDRYVGFRLMDKIENLLKNNA